MRLTLFSWLALTLISLAPAAPEKWADAIAKFEQVDAPQPPLRHGIVFVGNSSIVKWTSLAPDFPGEPVINRGFDGSELADSVFYLDRIVIPYALRLVVLYAGDNDLNAGKSPAAVCADFKAFVAKVHAALPETRIIFISIKPIPSRWRLRDRMERTNSLIAAECAKDPQATFVDVYHPMLGQDGQPRPELFASDRLHMNAAGCALWRSLLAPLVKTNPDSVRR